MPNPRARGLAQRFRTLQRAKYHPRCRTSQVLRCHRSQWLPRAYSLPTLSSYSAYKCSAAVWHHGSTATQLRPHSPQPAIDPPPGHCSPELLATCVSSAGKSPIGDHGAGAKSPQSPCQSPWTCSSIAPDHSQRGAGEIPCPTRHAIRQHGRSQPPGTISA